MGATDQVKFYFTKTEISPGNSIIQLSPDARENSIIFERVSAIADKAGSVASVAIAIAATIEGKDTPHKLSFTIRGTADVDEGGHCALMVLDGKKLFRKTYTSSKDVYFHWERPLESASVIQLCIWLACHTPTDVTPVFANLIINSLDMEII